MGDVVYAMSSNCTICNPSLRFSPNRALCDRHWRQFAVNMAVVEPAFRLLDQGRDYSEVSAPDLDEKEGETPDEDSVDAEDREEAAQAG